MEKNREGRRGTMAALNGSGCGLQRRRHRSGSRLRDSPEEDGGLETQETGRLRDRSTKRDRDRDRDRERDRDRSSRSKRRRGDRLLHGSRGGEEEDSSEGSVDNEEEEDDDNPGGVPVRMTVPPTFPLSSTSSMSMNIPQPLLPPPSSPSPALPIHHQHRRSLPAKVTRSPAVWKAADEMIGVSIPRKARSGAAKRSPQELLVSGSGPGGGGGCGAGGELTVNYQQTSTSPMRPSPASTAPISPTSSNTSVRKKMRIINGSKHHLPKISKPSDTVQDIEFEVAEVLFGMTRQLEDPVKHEAHRQESKEANGSANDAKSHVSSPTSIFTATASSHTSILPVPNLSSLGPPLLTVALPKRKKLRPVMCGDESLTSLHDQGVPTTSVSCTAKADAERTSKDVPSPNLENGMSLPTVANGAVSRDTGLPQNTSPESKTEVITAVDSEKLLADVVGCGRKDDKESTTSSGRKQAQIESNATREETSAKKATNAPDILCGEKFNIDLMAPPPGKLSPEVEIPSGFAVDHKRSTSDDVDRETELGKLEEKRLGRDTKQEFGEPSAEKTDFMQHLELRESPFNERKINLQLDIEKMDENGPSSSGAQAPKQPSLLLPLVDSKLDTIPASVPLPMTFAGWPGGLPPSMGYMGQLPSIDATFPLDGINKSSKAMQPAQLPSPWLRPKRCATHCCIAQNINYHQHVAKMHPFLAAASGGIPLHGPKLSYNLNVVPSSESILVNPFQGVLPTRNVAPLQDRGGLVAVPFGGQPLKDKNNGVNTFLESVQKKQLVLQKASQGSSTSSMLHTPSFIFPLNQQQLPAASARSGAVKSVTETPGNTAVSSNASHSASILSAASGTPGTNVNFNYANLPPSDAQYLAILQNNGYPFPFPAHIGSPPQFRGASPAQALTFFNGSFYASPMFHPSQLQQQAQILKQQAQTQQPRSNQQGHPNTSTSNGSTNSQKNQQQLPCVADAGVTGLSYTSLGLPISKTMQELPHHSARLVGNEIVSGGITTKGDTSLLNAEKGAYHSNLTLPFHPQEFTLMSHSEAGNGNHSDKHNQMAPLQQQNMKTDAALSQAFAMSFASFNRSASSANPPTGLDFSSMAQNHPQLQSLPETAKHGYQIRAAQTSRQKEPQRSEDGKSCIDTLSIDGESKLAGKAQQGFSHPLALTRPDGDASIASILSNSAIKSTARPGNLNSSSSNVNRSPNITSGVTTTSVVSSNMLMPNSQEHNQQQHLIQLQQQLPKQQKQQQFFPRSKASNSSNTAGGVYSDHLSSPPGLNFPSAVSSFPQHSGTSTASGQSPQWKNNTRITSGAQSSSAVCSVKNYFSPQQGRNTDTVPSTVSHQTQISFGLNSHKITHPGPRSSGSNLLPALGAAVTSPQNSVSRNDGGSPNATSSSKPGLSPTALPTIHQQAPLSKESLLNSSCGKSSPVRNHKTSNLGQPSSSSIQSSSKSQQHQQLHKHPFPQAQLYFGHAYLPGQSPQANVNAAAAAAGYYQRRPSEQHQHQQHQQPRRQKQQLHPPSPNVMPNSAGMISRCPPHASSGATATSESAKAVETVANNSTKGLQSSPVLQSAQPPASSQSAAVVGGAHEHMTSPMFPYIPAMPSISVKAGEQKSPAGNDNLRACWQPEKK